MPRPPTEPELQALDELNGLQTTILGVRNRVSNTDIVWTATPLEARRSILAAMAKLRDAADLLAAARHATLDAGREQA